MADGCPHAPAASISGYEVESLISGPYASSAGCVVTSDCASSHIFEVRNYHLYKVQAEIEASSIAQIIEVCEDSEDAVKRTQWTMEGQVPAAPFRPHRNQPVFGARRFDLNVRAIDQPYRSDTIDVTYSIDSPVNGRETGMSFGVPVLLG